MRGNKDGDACFDDQGSISENVHGCRTLDDFSNPNITYRIFEFLGILAIFVGALALIRRYFIWLFGHFFEKSDRGVRIEK